MQKLTDFAWALVKASRECSRSSLRHNILTLLLMHQLQRSFDVEIFFVYDEYCMRTLGFTFKSRATASDFIIPRVSNQLDLKNNFEG